MRINNNIMAMNTHRQLGMNQSNGAKSLEKLSSGLRINRAGDDAAGLAISEKMRGQIRGLNQAQRNAQDGISLIQTAEGALNETHSILQRMRELAVQAANDTNTTADRGEIQKEIDELAKEITRIADNTEYNTQNLLNGEFSGKFHIGANNDQSLELSIANMDASELGVSGTSTTYSGGSVGSVSGDASEVTVSMGAYAGDNVVDVAVNTAGLTVETVADSYVAGSGSISGEEGVAAGAGVSIGLGTYAGGDVENVSFDTSGVTLNTETVYTSADPKVLSGATFTQAHSDITITWSDAPTAADGEVEISEIVVSATGDGTWSASSIDENNKITFTNTNGDSFVYDASAISSGTEVSITDVAGTGTFGHDAGDSITSATFTQAHTDITLSWNDAQEDGSLEQGEVGISGGAGTWTVDSVDDGAKTITLSNGTETFTFNASDLTPDGTVTTINVIENYSTGDPNVSEANFSGGYTAIKFTWTDAPGLSDGAVAQSELGVTGGNGNWQIDSVNANNITLSNDNGESFVYNGDALVSGTPAIVSVTENSGQATYGGQIVVGDTTFGVNGDGSTSVAVSGAYDDLEISIGVGFVEDAGAAAGSFDIAGQEEAGATTNYGGTITIGGTAVSIAEDGTGTVTSGNYKGLTVNVTGAQADQTGTFSITGRTSETTEGGAGIDVSTREDADTAISAIDTAIEKVSQQRSALGAIQNRLEHTISNLGTSSENLQAAESRIRDVDMAAEMMQFTKNNILQQAATAMLAQANMAPQSVLQLLG